MNILDYSSNASNAPMTSVDILLMDSTVAACLHCDWVKDINCLQGGSWIFSTRPWNFGGFRV